MHSTKTNYFSFLNKYTCTFNNKIIYNIWLNKNLKISILINILQCLWISKSYQSLDLCRLAFYLISFKIILSAAACLLVHFRELTNVLLWTAFWIILFTLFCFFSRQLSYAEPALQPGVLVVSLSGSEWNSTSSMLVSGTQLIRHLS